VAFSVLSNIELVPLGAGDLIDRAIRLYRRHFLTLLRIAAPPVMVSAAGGVMSTIGWRGITITSRETSLAVYVFLIAFGLILTWSGLLFQVIVMGGATRNLVTHLLWNEPVSARKTYGNVRMRFWGLLGAAFILALWTGVAGAVTVFALYISLIILFLGSFAIAQVFPMWVVVVLAVVGFGILSLLALSVFFFIVGKVAYLPQVMLVEGKGVFDAIGRSFTLSRGNIRRLMAMAIFSWLAAYSALMLFGVPLGIYGYLNGINPLLFNATGTPAWYAVVNTVLAQFSSIIIAPVWMLGLSLLYVDERVRHEGYDIELMAARQLGEMPALSRVSEQFYTPALAVPHAGGTIAPVAKSKSDSMLGLR
jgi:hypothetical protein